MIQIQAEDPVDEEGRRRRAKQMAVAGVIVVILGSVVGMIGTRQANAEASRERRKLAAALAGMTFAEAAGAPFNGQLARVEAAFGGGLNWDGGDAEPEFTTEVVGWWFWAPRCLVGVVDRNGPTVTVYADANCPPAHQTVPTTVPGYPVP